MKWEYLTAIIREGGEENYHTALEMDRFGSAGWEFCAWADEHWSMSEGPGPNRREALFKRPIPL